MVPGNVSLLVDQLATEVVNTHLKDLSGQSLGIDRDHVGCRVRIKRNSGADFANFSRSRRTCVAAVGTEGNSRIYASPIGIRINRIIYFNTGKVGIDICVTRRHVRVISIFHVKTFELIVITVQVL